MQDFAKAGATTLYMPYWDWPELLAGSRLYGLTEDEVLPLYQKWGGTARYVLGLARNASRQMDLEDATGKANLDAIYRAVGNIDTADEVWNVPNHALIQLLQLQPAESFCPSAS